MLNPGSVLQSRYRIVKMLGQGGFGAVYKAWDLNLSRQCAVKENLESTPEAQRQFMREATVLANLSHPNLPRVTDYFIIPEQGQYLVMDFIEGEDLQQKIDRAGNLAVSDVMDWTDQVMDALIYLHTRVPPVLHRDIKPSNIKITPDGKAVLVDFGLVKIYDANTQTTTGARAVSVGYAPPEQYGQGGTDVRSDIYALAATIYMALTEIPPVESVQRLVNDSLQPAHTLRKDVPIGFGMAIRKAMELLPANRFQTMQEFKKALFDPAYRDVPVIGVSAQATVRTAPSMVTPPVSIPAPAHRALQAQKPRSRLKNGLTALGSTILCFATGVIIIGLVANSPSNKAKQTENILATSEMRASLTMAAETSTAIAQEFTQQAALTQAAEERSKMTATSFAITSTAMQNLSEIDGLWANAVPKFGPASGNLVHEEDGMIEEYKTKVSCLNCIIQAVFINPYGGDEGYWDIGFFFRDTGSADSFRLIIFSTFDWYLNNYVASPTGIKIQSGVFRGLNTGAGEQNTVTLITSGVKGYLLINNVFVSELDLSSRNEAGVISLGTGFYSDDEIAGYKTGFTDFQIWTLP
jgi:serine/threonine protein kinase